MTGIPRLSDTHLREIDELVAVVGAARYGGWCWDGGGTVCVDLLGPDGKLKDRFPAENLHKALRLAREAAEAARVR